MSSGSGENQSRSHSQSVSLKPEWGSRTDEIFERVEQVGEGTYGQVYKARNKETGEIVALKRVRMDNEKEGFPITAIREIKILKELQHENIVTLKEIVTSKEYNTGHGSVFMVFEYMDHDLTGLLDSLDAKFSFSLPQIKCYMQQLLEGLFYCHQNNVLHRDIKGSNLLINNSGQLKLGDFGLARPYSENANNYTNRVITLWYRPPELLLGATAYGPAIDMWSVGCILAELLAKKPIFPGRNEIDQLDMIFRLCGTPDSENWPDVENLPLYKMFKPQRSYKRSVREFFRDFPDKGLDLVDRLLSLDPRKRISANEALDHDFFFTEPMPCDKKSLPQYPSSHEWQTKKKRQQHQQQQHQQQQQAHNSKRIKSSNETSGKPSHPSQNHSYHGQHASGQRGPGNKPSQSGTHYYGDGHSNQNGRGPSNASRHNTNNSQQNAHHSHQWSGNNRPGWSSHHQSGSNSGNSGVRDRSFRKDDRGERAEQRSNGGPNLDKRESNADKSGTKGPSTG